MNGSCAGGTGAFIDQMATLLKTDADGLNELAKNAKTMYPIASRCGVFAKTDVPWAPWNVTYSNDKKRARLNIISHLLSSIAYKKLDTEKVKLPQRKIGKDYQEKNYPFKLIPEKF